MSDSKPALNFSPQDANTLIALAQNAPLQNLRQAEQVSQLLQRFGAWYASVVAPAGEATEAPKPRKRRGESPPVAAPETKSEDLLK